MILHDQNGLAVEVATSGWGEDVMIESAVYVDTGLDVDEATLEYLYDTYADALYEEGFENAVRAADFYEQGDW